MRSVSAVLVLTVGLLPSAVVGMTQPGDQCSVDAVLRFLAGTCSGPIPEACAKDLAKQATAWCGSYLSIEPVTVHLRTETPVFTETVTDTSMTTLTSTVVV